MSELQDFDLEPTEESQKRGPLTGPIAIAIGVIVVAVLGFFIWRWSQQRQETEPVEEAAPAVEAPAAEGEIPESTAPVDLPTLADSDEWMRAVVAQLSAHPELFAWLATEDLIRRFVVVVDNLAEGVSPRTHLEFLEPEKGFGTREDMSRVYVDDSAYQRYDRIADVVSSIDVRGTANLYRSVKPLLQEAYRELGYPNKDFDDALLEAIDTLLRTPVVEGQIELVPKVSSFEFADSKLEELTEAEKHFLRLGPDNLRKIQAKARAIALEIGLPQSQLSPAR
jgi:HAMP domain-containing protein